MQGNVLLKHTPTQSTYLLSHKERQPSDSVFKQQRFLERRKCEWHFSLWMISRFKLGRNPTLEWVNSLKLAARLSSSMSLSVLIATFKIWIGSSRMLWKTTDEHISKLGCAGLQVNGAVAFRDPFLITLLSSSPYRTGFPPSGKVGLGGGESVKQLNTSVMFLKKKAKPQTPLITSSPTKDRMEDGDGRTGWTPGRSGTQPWLPCADRAAWTTCRARRRWHWLRAPCRSGSD